MQVREDVGKTYQSVSGVIAQLDSTIALLKAEAAKQANHTGAAAAAGGAAASAQGAADGSAANKASDLASELGKALGVYSDAAPNATTGAWGSRSGHRCASLRSE